ncbi:MAG: phytanoyl-CoA dioxygenase family protein [Vicinamibacterales bacterium]
MTGSTPTSLHLLSPREIEQFERDGFVVVRRLADEELCARMRALTQAHVAARLDPVEYEADTRYEGAPVSRVAPGGRTVRRLLQAFARDPLFREWALSDAIAGRLRQLLGPSIALSQAHHNCVMTKHPAFSSVTGWHQDIRYWSFRRPDLVSAWLALGPERADNGGLLLVPGSHRLDLRPEQFDAALFFRTDVAGNREVLARQIVAELDAGDVLLFHARLLHAAGNNRTDVTKFAVVFTFHAQDNVPLAGTRSASVSDVLL